MMSRINAQPRWIQYLCLGLALLCTLLFVAAPTAQAGTGYGPGQYKSGYTYGNGIFFAPYRFHIYAEPNDAAKIVESLHWSRAGSLMSDLNQTPRRSGNAFFCFYPQLDVAMMAVIGDTDTGWVEVVYDQSANKTGWVKLLRGPDAENTGAATAEAAPPSDVLAQLSATGSVDSDEAAASAQTLPPLTDNLPSHMGLYQTWQDFMKLNAKAHGIYWLGGVTQYHRSIRMSDDDKSKMIPLTIVRDLKVKHVRGNWLLVEVLDFERNTPIGWVRWRDNDGNLMVFPNFTGDKGPVVTTVY